MLIDTKLLELFKTLLIFIPDDDDDDDDYIESFFEGILGDDDGKKNYLSKK